MYLVFLELQSKNVLNESFEGSLLSKYSSQLF